MHRDVCRQDEDPQENAVWWLSAATGSLSDLEDQEVLRAFVLLCLFCSVFFRVFSILDGSRLG